mgnify:CR=1 FL=1|tara:strand:- start:25397 stop:26095 length:699 start_codon:yes stop_codon:yes gene_type:complete
MKKLFFLSLLLLFTRPTFSQDNWFMTYTDSIMLVADAKKISEAFIGDIHKIAPDLNFGPHTVLNTTPAMIYYENKTVNLPLWEQLPPPLVDFLYEVSGGESEGKEVFGLFFNGFYLPHELGHALQDRAEQGLAGSYKNEYFANTVAMLWWRKEGRQDALEQCYGYAKKMLATLPDPVPEGTTANAFFTEHYGEALQNPYVYGFMQFSQFVDIYGDSSLPEFDAFIRTYLGKN